MIRAVILAAGNGTRMQSSLPKVLHQIACMPLLQHVLIELACVKSITAVTVVANQNLANHKVFLSLKAKYGFDVAIQHNQLGTADALKSANITGGEDIIVTCADTPLLKAATFERLIKAHQSNNNQATCVCFNASNPKGYGRIKLNNDGNVVAIVEQKNLKPNDPEIHLCNSGIMMLGGKNLATNLSAITPDAITNELYLTSIVQIINNQGGICGQIITPEAEVLGVNTKQQLLQVDNIMQDRIIDHLLIGGVQLIRPTSSYFARDINAGRGVVIQPNVYIGQGVEIGADTTIHSFSHLERCVIGQDNIIGPFARIRPNTTTEEDVKIGNFVEVKNSTISMGTKASHLAYIGDAKVGLKVNIGAGAIFCNYDGVNKHHTNVGNNAFIGSNSCLVAPVDIADGSFVAAGSVITKNTETDKIAINRTNNQHHIKKRQL